MAHRPHVPHQTFDVRLNLKCGKILEEPTELNQFESSPELTEKLPGRCQQRATNLGMAL